VYPIITCITLLSCIGLYYGVCLGDPTLIEASYMQSTFITHLLFAEQSYVSRKVSGIRLAVAFFCVRPDRLEIQLSDLSTTKPIN
jgi:hypothetical protein